MVKVLVVDDDQDTRDALRFLLEDAGYSVAEAMDGLRALAMIQASDVSMVVLLDLDLPRFDGIQVLEAVANDIALAARHAFIMVTAVAPFRYQAADEYRAQLSVPMIPKPFDLDTLLDAVAAAAQRLR